jgi:hypothetical protein
MSKRLPQRPIPQPLEPSRTLGFCQPIDLGEYVVDRFKA